MGRWHKPIADQALGIWGLTGPSRDLAQRLSNCESRLQNRRSVAGCELREHLTSLPVGCVEQRNQNRPPFGLRQPDTLSTGAQVAEFLYLKSNRRLCMEQSGLRLLYGLWDSAALRTESSHCGFLLLAKPGNSSSKGQGSASAA